MVKKSPLQLGLGTTNFFEIYIFEFWVHICHKYAESINYATHNIHNIQKYVGIITKLSIKK